MPRVTTITTGGGTLLQGFVRSFLIVNIPPLIEARLGHGEVSEDVIALSPLDAAHNAARMPNDNFPPPLDEESSHIVESINAKAEGGMTRPR